MKNTVTAFVLALLMILGFTTVGQTQQRIEEKIFSADLDEKIRLNLRFGDSIIVKGWDRNEVSFRAVVEINSGSLNDAFVTNYVEEGEGIRVETDFDKDKLEDGRASDCPDNRYNSYSWNRGGNHRMVCSNITFEIFIPGNSDLKLETISADVELYDLNGPVDAKSISGFIDLSWPDTNGADLSMRTVTGEAYSNLENLTFINRKEHFPHVGYELRGAIGSGGPMIRLESVSGDLYLRKTDG